MNHDDDIAQEQTAELERLRAENEAYQKDYIRLTDKVEGLKSRIAELEALVSAVDSAPWHYDSRARLLTLVVSEELKNGVKKAALSGREG